VRELWAVAGRRSGKSRIAAAICAFLALWADRTRLSPGEVGYVLCLSASRAQASLVHQYAVAFIEASPVLRQEIVNITSDEIELRGNIVIGIHSANFKTVRGRTLLGAVIDEVAYLQIEGSASPDAEVYRALRPALSTTSGMMVGISSPYAMRGLLFEKVRATFGKDDADVLTVRGATQAFNPTIDVAVIAAAKRDDPEAAKAEWDGEFRGDLQSYVDRDRVLACVDDGVIERPFHVRYRYFAYCDPSGGSVDSMATAIAHCEGERVVLDAVLEIRPPFSPVDAVTEIVDAELNRSELFLQFLPLLTSGNCVLLDQPRIVNQIAMLERRTGRTGRDAIDHRPGQHDDVAVVTAGALVTAASMGAKLAAREAWRARQPERQRVCNVGHAETKRIHGAWGGPAQSRHSNEGLRRGVAPWPTPAPDPFDNLYSPEFRGDGWKRI
jgi:hypothetical protein